MLHIYNNLSLLSNIRRLTCRRHMSFLYTKSHEYVRKTDDTTATIGISKYAVKQLGDIVFIETPEIDTTIEKGEIACNIESVKAAGDIYSPLTGTIVEVNEKLDGEPDLINLSPESDGWIFNIKFTNPEELDELMDKTAYEDYCKKN